uniref:Uncharacterized protein n=1 Tax=Panagrolaimus sp. PS1159 TaxID=55785 RepID=A0AC35GPK1_9BILA
MKLCFKILFCFFLVFCLGFLDASNDSLILDGNILDEVNGLLSSDGSVTAKQKDKDVELSGTGQINLTLDNGELELKVCKDRCIAKSTVCYESENGLSDSGAAGTCFESSCKVEIEWKKDEITFGRALFLKKRYYLYRKRQTSKRIPPNVDRKQLKSTKAKDAAIETATKKDDFEAAKIQPKKSQKKEKIAKTTEPPATEDIPAAAKIAPKKKQKKTKTQEPTTAED